MRRLLLYTHTLSTSPLGRARALAAGCYFFARAAAATALCMQKRAARCAAWAAAIAHSICHERCPSVSFSKCCGFPYTRGDSERWRAARIIYCSCASAQTPLKVIFQFELRKVETSSKLTAMPRNPNFTPKSYKTVGWCQWTTLCPWSFLCY